MYASVLLALAATSAFAAPVASPPKGWAHGYLEDYDTCKLQESFCQERQALT
jgi:hypothetical protein